MCGIAGWVSVGRTIDAGILTEMRDSMEHRGPDGSGLWISPNQSIGLAHRRLAIIDLSPEANQPMHDSAANTHIIYNGEIYNHRELRKELERSGSKFETDHSDTEVILKGYSRWGLDELLRRLNGMFAFAIFDGNRGELVLARDRMGIKPLYLFETPGTLLFASEIKALLLHPEVPRSLHHENFWHFLAFRSLPAPRCLFEDIQKVPPGAYVVYDIDSLSATRHVYWDPIRSCARFEHSMAEAADALEELLRSSVTYRLEADTDVGVFLSGGLDSTYLLETANERHRSLSTFTASYEAHPDYHEGDVAKLTAQRLGTRHFDVDIDDELYLQSLVDVAYYQDEPIAAPVCVPVYLLSQAAEKAGVPVVLAGEGSDELFIGYDNWLRLRSAQKLVDRLPAAFAAPIGALSHGILKQFTSMERPAEFARRMARVQPLFWGGAMDFTSNGRHRIVGKAIDRPETSTFDAIIQPLWTQFGEMADSRDVTLWMSYVDTRFRLPELMLPRLDKMGMAFSVEGRVPFLDHRIVEFVMGLPRNLRADTGGTGKPLFKNIAARRLPQDFVYQRKRGFQAPVKEWKSKAFKSIYLEALVRFSERTGIFDADSVRDLLQRRSDRLYFTLLNFMIWYSIFIENVVPDLLGELTPRGRSK